MNIDDLEQHSFSMYTKFYKQVTFPTPNMSTERFVGRFCIHNKWMIARSRCSHSVMIELLLSKFRSKDIKPIVCFCFGLQSGALLKLEYAIDIFF